MRPIEIFNLTGDPLGTPEEHANRIRLTQTKLESIIGDTYRLGWNAACKTAERKDLTLEDEETPCIPRHPPDMTRQEVD